jgi:vancomycin permeability regulator SanA
MSNKAKQGIFLGIRICFFAFFIASFLLIVISRQTVFGFSDQIYTDVDALPVRDIALVFGGGMEDDGSQSTMQRHRVEAGVDLYKAGKVKQLIMTGDDGQRNFNEIDAMKAHAISLGIPIHHVTADPHGYRTYESCYREKHVYDIEKVTAISQEFHLPRILYFCNHFGINTIGYSANSKGYEHSPRMETREVLARVKGWLQINITKPLPRSLEK